MNWASKSADNILPYSEEKESLAAALDEWRYTGDMYDLEEPIETCELCNHPDIRYQFKIRNYHNGNEMLVGSECINKFEIKAIDAQGYILDRDESRKKVSHDRRYLVSEARKKRLINTLVELSKREEEDFDIESFINYVQGRGAFTPKQLFFLFWRLDEHNIDYKPTDFKVVMRRNREKDQLRSMPEWKMKKLWRSMTTAQKKWIRENTTYEPGATA